MKDEKDGFAFGPEKTAAEIVPIFDGWRHVRELDEAAWKARREAGIRSAL
jgi:hypothetical protein